MQVNYCKDCSYFGKQYKICEYEDCKPIEEIHHCPIEVDNSDSERDIEED